MSQKESTECRSGFSELGQTQRELLMRS